MEIFPVDHYIAIRRKERPPVPTSPPLAHGTRIQNMLKYGNRTLLLLLSNGLMSIF